MIDGILKLLYPDGVFTKEQVAEALTFALEMRRRVKEQLKKLGYEVQAEPYKTGSGQFTLGSQGDYQYLQVIYPITFLPSFMTAWLDASTKYNGKPAYLIISTAAFRVESY